MVITEVNDHESGPGRGPSPAWDGGPLPVERVPAGLVEAVIRGVWASHPSGMPDADLFLHPNLVMAAARIQSKEPVVLRHRNGHSAGGPLAVLVPKTVNVAPLLPTKLLRRLAGLRLVGSQILGQAGEEEIGTLIRAVLGMLQAGETECALFEDIRYKGELWTSIINEAGSSSAALLHIPSEPQPHWYVDFSDCPTDYWSRFSKKTRYNLRSTSRKLPHELICCSAPDEVGPFLSDAHKVSQASWQARRIGVRIGNTEHERQWLAEIAALGAFRSYILKTDGCPVAFALGFQWNGRYQYEEIGYDLAYANASPGTVLLVNLIDDLLARDSPVVVDFGFGDAEYKQVFGTRNTVNGSIALVRRTMKNRVALRLERERKMVGRNARHWAGNSRMFTRLRQLYRSV